MTTTRIPWTDQFRTPTMQQLRKHLQADAAELFDRARKAILKFDDIVEAPRWYGDCWFWSLGYFLSHEQMEDDDPVAIIIPAPEDLQLAMPVEQAFLDTLNVRRLKRAIRDGLELGQTPFHTRWAFWSLTANSVTDEILSVVTQRHAWLMG
ncbi:MAG: hypothetical protein MK101_07860 [Phycisphaerales bacterium]|nr:hypothetical protein [Phycisphaerales bacterium]